MNNTFIKKYKPKTLDKFNLEPDFLHVLQSCINIKNVNVLLVGEAGTGKTSLIDAIISTYYNNETNSSNYSNNVLYINNLKDQGINYYRNDVKTFCQTTSSIVGKKKYVVLDDIDFMNEQSQQVFRNTTDKYKTKVNFIASCTNIQKVIDSIQSRFIIIKIKSTQSEGMMTVMNKVSSAENIDITPEAKEFIVQVCNFSIKAMLNYLEKFKLLQEKITLELVMKICTNIGFQIFENYTTHLRNDRLHEAIIVLYDLYDNGYSVLDILDTYFMFVKLSNTFSEDEKYKIIPIICKYISIFHEIHENEVELSLFTNNIYICIKKI